MRLLSVVLATAAASGLVACGSSDHKSGDKTPATPVTATPAGANALLPVTATEYSFDPPTVKEKAGKLTVTMKNAGKYVHEFVLLKTNAAANSLKVTNGSVSEAASVGEISETKPGTTASHTFDLKPGSYVYVCNIPGHYGDGMRGTITVG